MMFVDELRHRGDDGALVFDGAGTTALAEMRMPGSDIHHTWIEAALRGACRCCAMSYGVLDALEAVQLPMPGDPAATPACASCCLRAVDHHVLTRVPGEDGAGSAVRPRKLPAG
jgi:hypothetical protein